MYEIELMAVRLMIAQARRESMERAAVIAKQGYLISPDGGSPTEDEVQMCNEIAAAIRAEIKTPVKKG